MRTFSFRPALTFEGRRFRGLRGFSGKPFHPPLTDATLGAYLLASAFDVVSYLASSQSWAHDLYRAGTFALIFGAISSVATVLTGFWDWLRSTQKGTQVRRTANAHAWTMVAMTMAVVVNLVLRLPEPDAVATPGPQLAASLVTLVLAVIGGMIGGSLVYDYGFNVQNSKDHPVWHPSETDVFPGERQG